ncbi:MAG: GGDEF domain-containing protein [Myxococcota bacterium]
MFFRKRKQVDAAEIEKKQDEPDASSKEPETPIAADRVVDFLADMLRIYGEEAFAVGLLSAEEIQQQFETWARHLLIGVPPPSREKPDPNKPAEPDAKRDLPGLRQAFRKHRKSEQVYVIGALGDYRDATWSYISGLRRSLSAEQTSNRQLGHRMRRLESAVRKGEPTAIKNEARETTSLLTEFLAERGEQHRAQITEMAARLEGLREELDSVRAKAAIDPLTQLYTRGAFDEQIEREVDLASFFGRRGCLVMLDIDHFKWVNDNHGHPAGDEVLRQIAATMSRCFMRRDDFLARYGGEEFVVVLRDIETPVASELAERGMMAIRNLEVEITGVEQPLRVTVSMGIARLRLGETAASWIERTDRALLARGNVNHIPRARHDSQGGKRSDSPTRPTGSPTRLAMQRGPPYSSASSERPPTSSEPIGGPSPVSVSR